MATATDGFLQKVVATSPENGRIARCLQCGACAGICPHGFAMDHPPRSVIAALRAGDLAPVVDSDAIWLCVSCFACSDVCPVEIPLTDGLLPAIKTEKLETGGLPEELQAALESSRRYGNALGAPPRKRGEWIRDLDFPVPILARAKEPVDVLWFVDDYASFHPRAQRATRALARILHRLGVRFGILGPEEVCSGDVQLLAGERGLFELLALKNAKTLAKYSFDRVLTSDPHTYNVLRNEYPKLGVEVPVVHATQLLVEHLDELLPDLQPVASRRVTYHDPCALGRAHGNGIYEEPRRLLEAIPGLELVEMPHHRAQSICCGGGGGGMWLDGFVWDRAGVRTTEWRVAEALAVGADVLAVACPYEAPRFEDAVKTTDGDGRLAVRDIAELLSESAFGEEVDA